MILVSACLAGLEVRYDGGHCLTDKVRRLVEKGQAVTVCPEVLGGLSTPREPAEIIGGNGEDVLDGKAKVIDIKGNDVTENFIKGAYAALKKAKELHATLVVLKENSPSCGSSMIYDGSFEGRKTDGFGVTAALLRRHHIQVISDEEFFLEKKKE
jgi:uncharacterized protein YbbK (DUF523 family)